MVIARLQPHLMAADKDHTSTTANVVASMRDSLHEEHFALLLVVIHTLSDDCRQARLVVYQTFATW